MYSEYSGSPGWGDRLADIEAGYKRRIKELEAEIDRERRSGQKAVKRILGIRQDARVSIDQYGFVEVAP
jgi:hypothetical protein